MKITEAETLILLRATEGYRTAGGPARTLELGLLSNDLPDTPGNQWAIELVTKAREKSS